MRLLDNNWGIETPKYQLSEYKLNPNIASGSVSTITSPWVKGSFGLATFQPFLSILNWVKPPDKARASFILSLTGKWYV